MRATHQLLAVALAVSSLTGPVNSATAAPTYLDAVGSPTPDGEAGRKAAQDALAVYPKPALKAGTEGWANLQCHPDVHFAPRNCTVQFEDPPDAGFGAVALKLAANTPANPDITLPPGDYVQTLEVLFCGSPKTIKPDLELPLHWPVRPSLLRTAAQAQIDAAWPADAKAKGQGGLVIMNCPVALSGALGACTPVIERPQGAGFAAAALTLAPDYKAAPAQYDGKPQDGQSVQISVQFGPRPVLMALPALEPAWMRCHEKPPAAR